MKLGPPLEPGTRVLVRLPSWLGDLVACEPALGALAARLGEPTGKGLSLAGPAQLLPILDGLYPDARRLPHVGRAGERAADWRGHDVAVLFTNSFRSAWTARRAGIPRRVGWARDGRGWLLTDAMTPALERGGVPLGLGRAGRGRRVLPRPFGRTCQELVGLLGAEVHAVRPRVSAGTWPEALGDWPPGENRAEGGYLLVNAGCRPHSAKGVPAQLFGAALGELASLGLPVLVVGGPGEEAAVRAVVDAAGARGVRVRATLTWIPSLGELSALCARARVAWTADAGPLHILRAHGTPRVVLQGPCDPRHTAELGQDEIRLASEVDCGPCHRERCPLPGPQAQRCFTRIDPTRLVRATVELLGIECPALSAEDSPPA